MPKSVSVFFCFLLFSKQKDLSIPECFAHLLSILFLWFIDSFLFYLCLTERLMVGCSLIDALILCLVKEQRCTGAVSEPLLLGCFLLPSFRQPQPQPLGLVSLARLPTVSALIRPALPQKQSLPQIVRAARVPGG